MRSYIIAGYFHDLVGRLVTNPDCSAKSGMVGTHPYDLPCTVHRRINLDSHLNLVTCLYYLKFLSLICSAITFLDISSLDVLVRHCFNKSSDV